MTRRTGLLIAVLLLACVPLSFLAAEETDSSGLISDKVKSDYQRPAKIPFPDSNPYTPAKADLGKMLFFDPILSGSRKISCASCHDPSKSWADGLQQAVGEDPAGLKIRTPTLIDIAFVDILGWDGKFQDLESVTFGPLMSPQNMNITERELVRRLRRAPRYLTPPSEKALSHEPELRRRWESTNAPSSPVKHRSIAGFRATRRPFLPKPSAGSRCSTARPTARTATAVHRSLMDPFRTLVLRLAPILEGDEFFRNQRCCATPSRLRRYATSRSVHPTCTMARFRLWKV